MERWLQSKSLDKQKKGRREKKKPWRCIYQSTSINSCEVESPWPASATCACFGQDVGVAPNVDQRTRKEGQVWMSKDNKSDFLLFPSCPSGHFLALVQPELLYSLSHRPAHGQLQAATTLHRQSILSSGYSMYTCGPCGRTAAVNTYKWS